MRILRVAVVPALVFASLPLTAAVDPGLLALVMPQATVAGGMDVRKALASPFGQFAWTHMPDHGSALLQMAAATGFDLRRDLEEILVARSTATGDWGGGILLARGTFQPDKFANVARAVGATITDYHGAALIVPANRRARTFSFLDSSTLAIGPEAEVKGVIDRRGAHTAFDSPLGRKAQIASGTGDAWFASVAPLAELLPAGAGSFPSNFLQAILETAAVLQFSSDGIVISAEALTHSPEEASAIANVLKFVAGMVKGPQAALVRSAQFTTLKSAALVIWSIAEQDLEQAFPAGTLHRAAR